MRTIFSMKIIFTFILTLFAGSYLSFSSTQPNVILIMVDDVGTGWVPPYAERLTIDDLEPEIIADYQSKRGEIDLEAHLQAARESMPNLNKLAGESMVFDRAFATSALCAPSRAGLLTGTFQQSWGAYRNVDLDNHGIPADRIVLAEPLKQAGYRNAMIGKWHVAMKDPAVLDSSINWNSDEERLAAYRSSSIPGQHPLDRGFDYYFGFNSHGSLYWEADNLWENRSKLPRRPPGEFLTELFTDKALEFMEEALLDEQPFFLYYSPKTLHGRIDPPPERFSDAFDTGTPFTNRYAGHLLALDEDIGRLLSLLEDHNALDNTLFIFTSDNGCTSYGVIPYNAPNRGGKGSAFLGGFNVPLIIWQEGVITPGISDELVSLVDLMPTILHAVGVDTPEGIGGLNLMPLLTGQTSNGPRINLGSAGLHSSRWSYSYETNGEINSTDAGDCPLYGWFMEGDMILTQITAIKPSLYVSLPDGYPSQLLLNNIADDRPQRINLADQLPEFAQEMSEDLRNWLQRQRIPLTSQQEDYRELADFPDNSFPIVDYTPPGTNIRWRNPDFSTGTEARWNFDNNTPMVHAESGVNAIIHGWINTSWAMESPDYTPNIRHFLDNGIQIQVARGAGVATSLQAVLLWKKEQFLNGANTVTMRFEPGALMSASFNSIGAANREIRFVVKQNGIYYVTIDRKTTNANSENPYIIDPTSMEWTTISADSSFTIGDAPLSNIHFDDIEAVGIYLDLSHPENQSNTIISGFTVTAVADNLMDEFSTLFPNAEASANSWYHIDSITSGWFHAGHFPWVYNAEHGWWWTGNAKIGNYWIFDVSLGWIHANDSAPDYYFRAHDQTWLYHQTNTGIAGSERKFYNYNTTEWEYN